jgi:hypothetical protein
MVAVLCAEVPTVRLYKEPADPEVAGALLQVDRGMPDGLARACLLMRAPAMSQSLA